MGLYKKGNKSLLTYNADKGSILEKNRFKQNCMITKLSEFDFKKEV